MKLIKQLTGLLILFSTIFCFCSFCTDNYQHNFSIAINSNNQLRVESESCKVEDLSELLYYYFTANMHSEYKEDYSAARYITYSKNQCLENIKRIEKDTLNFNPKQRLLRHKRNLCVMNFLKVTSIRTLHPIELVHIKMKAKTSYKTYISVLSEIKKNTNRIRHQVAKKLFNLSYRKITVNQKSKLMRQYLFILKVLVPERIAESPVKN